MVEAALAAGCRAVRLVFHRQGGSPGRTSSVRPRPPPSGSCRRGGTKLADSAIRRSGSRTSSTQPEASCRASEVRSSAVARWTVTDPRATRLLMTSTEAVGLALVAGAVGDPGGAFWLDVGPPVQILGARTARCRGTRYRHRAHRSAPGRESPRRVVLGDGEARRHRVAVSSGLLLPGSTRRGSTRGSPSWRTSSVAPRMRESALRSAAPHEQRAGELAASAVELDDQLCCTNDTDTALFRAARRGFRPAVRDTRQSLGTRLLRVGPRRGRELAAAVVARTRHPTCSTSAAARAGSPRRCSTPVRRAYLGIDVSPHMLQLARGASSGSSRVELVEGDFLRSTSRERSTSCSRSASSTTSTSRRAPRRGCARAAPRRSWPRSRRRDRIKAPVRQLRYDCPTAARSYYYGGGAEALLAAAGLLRTSSSARTAAGAASSSG